MTGNSQELTKLLRSRCSKNRTSRILYQEALDLKTKQMADAVQHCKDNNCRGWAALKTGLFPLIKCPLSVNKNLDGLIQGTGREYCSLLTDEEERVLVTHMLNKARAYQPLGRKEVSKFILVMLEIRRRLNRRTHGRRNKKLSTAAKTALQKQKISRKFWDRFDIKFANILRKKRRGSVSINRATACTKEMAVIHIDGLAQELIDANIFTNATMVEPGHWTGTIDGSRVFNRDETPQFLNYGIDGTSRNIFYCGKGEECKGLIAENRECVSIEPIISLNGDIVMCHVLFSADAIKSNMAPKAAVDNIDGLLISATERGFQTGKSCLRSYQQFDKYLIDANIQKPVVMLTDGHSSRLDLEVLRFCEQKQIYQYVTPPDTTGLLQPLDQVNSKLHSCYAESTEQLYIEDRINRETFMTLLGGIWKEWTTKESLVRAFKRCGIESDKLSVGLMQEEKFKTAALLASPSTPSTAASKWDVISP